MFFETVFVLIKDLSFKVILGNLFMALFYPLLMIDEGVKTNVLGNDILFKFISPLILKEVYSLNNVTIDINKERYLSEILLVNQLTKTYCSNLPTAFWHRHRHIIQSLCEKDSNGKHTKIELFLFVNMNGLTV